MCPVACPSDQDASGVTGHRTWPAYRSLPPSELAHRAAEAVALLADCRLCPRDCGVDRLTGQLGTCRTGRWASVASAFAHHGEEDCLRGRQGSGTVFFTQCGLRCAFCQNFDISQGASTSHEDVTAGQLAAIMLRLQEAGCHNINLVTPSHVVPQVLEALALAAARGLVLPIVYNSSGYECPATLALLDDVVDIYMPDFKVWSTERGRSLLQAADYAENARLAIAEMHRQVGDLTVDASGLARRGVLVRHLVMPGMLDETEAILAWVADALGRETHVNLMDQYRPAGRVGDGRHPEIDRPLSRAEYQDALFAASRAGLRRLDGYRQS